MTSVMAEFSSHVKYSHAAFKFITLYGKILRKIKVLTKNLPI